MNSCTALFAFFLSLQSFSQVDGENKCKPNIDMKVNVCGSKFQKDSSCPACYECQTRLVVSDTSFSIISFLATAGGEGFDGDIMEAPNQGAIFNSYYLKNMLTRLRSGSFIEFSCIKAKYKNGNIIYILQPLYLELK